MKRLLGEPLVHFLLIGAALFLLFDFAGKRTSGAPGTIVITRGQIASLASGFSRTWQRPPTAEELEGLIQDRLREEVYCREAIALGLDKDDTMIRRRLRQKMEFLSEDFVAQGEPEDADLESYLREHPEAFRIEPRFTFSHVYLSPERRGAEISRDAARVLASLTKAGPGADPSRFGDSFLLGYTYDAVPAGEVAKQFGEPFAARLGELVPGSWQGPVESGYGLHLVFLASRTEGAVPELAAIRDAVRREWINGNRLEANEAFYRALLDKYTVTIERP